MNILDFDSGAELHPGYRQALEHLYSRLDTEALDPKRFATVERDIETYSEFLRQLGDPHLARPTLHVTGTRGKGSFLAMLESILQTAGYKTGATISPHLVEVRERVRVNGEPVSFYDFARLYEELRPAAESTLGGGNYRTVFELITALAFLAFRDFEVDLGLVEVGLGGRLDATNVVSPLLSVVTTIGLDHTHLLGSTVEEIAWDKGHIIKQGTPSISAEQPGDAASVLEKRAGEMGSDHWRVGRDIELTIRSIDRTGCRFDVATPHRTHSDLHIPLLGAHMARNAALSVAAADRLDGDKTFPLSEQSIREGLSRASWPGRGEVLHVAPTLLLDGAHTAQGAKVLDELLETCWPDVKRIFLLGMNRDKDIQAFLRSFRRKPDHTVATAALTPRAATPEELAALLDGEKWSATASPLAEALQVALDRAGGRGIVIATGSLYLVGAVRRIWLRQLASSPTFSASSH